MTNTSTILGIDPGLNRTGYAVVRLSHGKPLLVEGGVIRSTKTESLAERVLEIGQGVREVLAEHAPATVAIEQVFSHSEFPKTAVLMAHARGTILYMVAECRVPIAHYTPRQVKRLLTGSGVAQKDQVQRAVMLEFGLSELLEPNDVADAAAIALCHLYCQRQQLRSN